MPIILPVGSPIIAGSLQSDTLIGTSGNDWIAGLFSPDDLSGLDGIDVIFGHGGNDLVDGGAEDDYLHGSQGDDTLLGGPGDDTLTGAAGTDVLTGGAGNDVYRLTDGLDTVVEGAGEGIDWVRLEAYSGPFVLPAHVENLEAFYIHNGAELFLSGNDLDNRLVVTGPVAFADVVHFDGLDGNDTVAYSGQADLAGGAGDDVLSGIGTLDGGDGDDVLSGEGVLLGGAGNDSISILGNLVQLDAGDGNDTINGTAGADVLDGGPGDDLLRGGDGADRLIATAGTDTLEGGAGDDVFEIRAGSPVTVEAPGEGTDLIRLVGTAIGPITMGENIENIEVYHIHRTTDVFITGNGMGNRLTVVGMPGSNRIIHFDAMGGNDTLSITSRGDFSGGDGDDILRASVLRRTSASTLSGGEGNDTVSGYGLLSGDAGNDAVFGRGTLSGGSGNDTISGRGSLSGDDGDDYITASFGYGSHLSGGQGNDTLDGAQGSTVDGDAGDDVISGWRSTLNGGEGNDTIGQQSLHCDAYGGAGDDRIFVFNHLRTGLGEDGNDTVTGSVGRQSLGGGHGDDSLDGGQGHDTLIGGAGRDILTGGADGDLFVFADGDFSGTDFATADRITDFETAGSTEYIDLRAVDADVATAGDQAFVFIGTAAFSHRAGQLRAEGVAGGTLVLGDTDGDGLADFAIGLDGQHSLISGDFLL